MAAACSTLSNVSMAVVQLTIRQRVRVVYERIVSEDEAGDEGELSNCFSIHSIKLSKNSSETSAKREFTAIFFQVCFHFPKRSPSRIDKVEYPIRAGFVIDNVGCILIVDGDFTL